MRDAGYGMRDSGCVMRDAGYEIRDTRMGMANWRDKMYSAFVTAGGLGCAPVAPGTFGTLAGVAIFVVAAHLAPSMAHPWILAGALVFVSALTVGLGPWAERRWQTQDPQHVVTDEVAGYLLTVLIFPGVSWWPTALAAFVAFRVFDIVKPFPIRRLERLRAGWGMLADDLGAGVYAGAALWMLTLFRCALP